MFSKALKSPRNIYSVVRCKNPEKEVKSVQINRSTDYALRILIAAAGSEGLISRSQLCWETGIPDAFTGKLLRILRTEGLLESKYGVAGGYRLSRSPAKITLYDVIKAMEGANLLKPFGKPKGALSATAESAKTLKELQKSMETTLKSVNLQGILDATSM